MGLIALAITVAAAVGGFVIAKNFVRRRLRFVDGVNNPVFPLAAGLLAAVVALSGGLAADRDHGHRGDLRDRRRRGHRERGQGDSTGRWLGRATPDILGAWRPYPACVAASPATRWPFGHSRTTLASEPSNRFAPYAGVSG